MFGGVKDNDTICSVSTPPGFGGISVIRVSGSKAVEFVSKSIKVPINLESHKSFFTHFYNHFSNEVIDQVMIVFYLNGKSFTGEDVAEISCHGSPIICELILDELVSSGCRLAERGEFTYRAFLNSKLDLIQAESVLSTIHSNSKLSAKLALKQLSGGLSVDIKKIEENILWCLAHIEAGIDFSTEGLDIVANQTLIDRLTEVSDRLLKLIDTYKSGRVIKDGFPLTLIGKPNVGKSSLMNLLLSENRSIISPIAGTTRDVVKDEFLYNGIKFYISDTAGIRNITTDPIEKIGIDKSFQEAKESMLNLIILDSLSECIELKGNADDLVGFLKNINLENSFFVFNKEDLIDGNEKISLLNNLTKILSERLNFNLSSSNVIFVSALESGTKDTILESIYSNFIKNSNIENISVSSSRQNTDLKMAQSLIASVISGLKSNFGSEFIAFDLKEALLHIQRVLGVVYDDQILDKVFKEFCLGK